MHQPDNYSLHAYSRMINDRARAQPFVDALRHLVGPDSVVLEIGTAAGYFALLCAQLGARRVYAVEPDSAIEVARLCAAGAPGSDRITWIKGLSTAIDLPEPADLVLGGLHGTLPFYNHNIDSMIDARRRHLRAGGSIMPRRDVLRVVPAQAPHEYAEVDSPWMTNPEGLVLAPGRTFIANQWWRARRAPASPEDLLATAVTWGEIDYRSVTSSNLDNSLQWTVERPGTMHGYYVWFDAELTDGIGYSNAPDQPELVYGRAFFPLEQATPVVPGDRIDARFSANKIHGQHVIRWNTHIHNVAGHTRTECRQSTFRGQPLNAADLKSAATDHVPQLGTDGKIDRTILNSMAKAQTLAQIADNLMRTYPNEFATAAKALARVTSVSLKYEQAPSTAGS